MKLKSANRKKGNNKKVRYQQYVRVLEKHKKDLQERYNVKEIGIFGSYVRGEQNKRSDLDIIVSYKQVPDLLSFIALENYLSKLLKKKVDLVRKEYIPEEARHHILEEAIIV